MIKIDITSNLREVTRRLDDFQQRQMPFAGAMALTALAKRVAVAETDALSAVFDKPTPFTSRSFGIVAATKRNLEAVVFAKDIQATYLLPYEFGGKQVLGNKRALLVPKGVKVNQYGNLPKGALDRLKGRPDVFIGSVTFKQSGQTVAGVWQRPRRGDQYKAHYIDKGGDIHFKKTGYGTKGNSRYSVGGVRTGLKLLIRWGSPVDVKQHLDYLKRARQIIRVHQEAEFSEALDRAMNTAR